MAQLALEQQIKSAAAAWRDKRYEGASPVTKRLLEFWFIEDQFFGDGSEFGFWRAQREAIEALIYCEQAATAVCARPELLESNRSQPASKPACAPRFLASTQDSDGAHKSFERSAQDGFSDLRPKSWSWRVRICPLAWRSSSLNCSLRFTASECRLFQ